MGSTTPTKSPQLDSDDENSIRTRSKIYARKSIKNDSQFKYSNESTEYEESNASPSPRRKVLYPELSGLNEDPSDTESPEEQPPEDREKTPFPAVRENSPDSSSFQLWFIIFASILLVIGVAYSFFSRQPITSLNDKTQIIDCSKIMDLNKKYGNQDKKLFKSLQAGIEGMYNKRTPQVPSVVTFFSTDENSINAVLSDVIKIAKKCINQTHDPLSLTHKDLNTEEFLKDNRKVISMYKSELEEKTIMIINNVDMIDGKIVGSLHSFADTHNPLVSESILYLTVKVPNEPSGNKADFIYTYLQNQWKDLASNIRDPLITRFIDQTFYINHVS